MAEVAQLRRWLADLRRPDRLATPDVVELLETHGRLPDPPSPHAVGVEAAKLLAEATERLRQDGSGQEAQLPYRVIRTCFFERAKLFQAAAKLGMSERQLSRERTRAINLLAAELDAMVARPERTGPVRSAESGYSRPRVPAIDGYVPRLAISEALQRTCTQSKLVFVTGPAGIGKTSLVADFVSHVVDGTSTLWYRVRPGLTDSLASLLYELAELRRSEGDAELAAHLDTSLPALDLAVATRIALRTLARDSLLLVIDDFHLVEHDERICGFLDEAISRLDMLKVVAITRHSDSSRLPGEWLVVPPASVAEVRRLLAQAGLDCSVEIAKLLHAWTNGVPQLVTLAGAWLKTVDPDAVGAELPTLATRAHVQEFLLSTITELLDEDDRAVLSAASIFRDRFSDDALAAVSSLTRGAVLDASHRLVRAHVATRSRDGSCAFFHATVRDYVYERLSAAERRLLHSRAAAWFRAMRDGEEADYHSRQAAQAARSTTDGPDAATRTRSKRGRRTALQPASQT